MPQGCEFAVAQRLILLDRWEAVCNKRRQRVDISATGNRSQLRILVEMVVVGVVANNMMIDLDRFGTGYSRRFATATARTASLGSHSRGIETKNIRKY